MFSRKSLLFLFIIITFGTQAQENPSQPFTFKWDNGFKLRSQDSIFSLDFGGYLLIDHGFYYQDQALTQFSGPLESSSGAEIRSALLSFSGEIYNNTNFKLQVDFGGDKVKLKDVYIGISDIPFIGNFRVGHFNEPFRLSSLTSSKYTTFMERGSNSDFTPLRNNGAAIFNDFYNTRLSAQLGVFRNANNNSNDILADDGYVIAGRVTGIPFRDATKKQLLHVGAALNYREAASREFEIAIAPGSHLAKKYVSTGIIQNVKNVQMSDFELAYIHGPFSLQTEYLSALVKQEDYTYQFYNYYGELSYFITGESKNYLGSYEGFGRVKPTRNFSGRQKGPGALEIAIQYSHTDLTDFTLDGGKQSEISLGINWYLNPVTRVMVNYVNSHLENRGNLDVVQARFQIDF